MPASRTPIDNVALLRSVFGPLERGESRDIQPFFDLFADDVVFKTAAGQARGKEAVLRYFANAAAALEFNQFVKPLEYYGEGNRVVMLGYETVTVKETGATHEGEYAFVFDLRDGVITRAVNIQDLSGFAEYAAEAVAKA